jgi:hypothetical protein
MALDECAFNRDFLLWSELVLAVMVRAELLKILVVAVMVKVELIKNATSW